jgi:ABC-2 type transport system ATP-binding protein
MDSVSTNTAGNRVLEVVGLRKNFGRRSALRGIDLHVQRGELFGLLGHNGAGKSTTIGILLGQIHADGGTAKLMGHDVSLRRASALAKVGAIFETPVFYDYLSGWRNLRLLADYSRPVSDEEMREVVALVGLSDRIRDKVRAYSHGMRQRLALAQALLPRPEILILDEPSEGLDPEGIRDMRATIVRLNREHGLTILLCSHLLAEVQQICSRLAILRQGRILFFGDWKQLASRRPRIVIETETTAESVALLARNGILAPSSTLELTDGRSIADAAECLVRAGHRIRRLAPAESTLEDFYMAAVDAARSEDAPR